jgi:hypothetical protein
VDDSDTFNLSIIPESVTGLFIRLLHKSPGMIIVKIPIPYESGKNGRIISLFIRPVPTYIIVHNREHGEIHEHRPDDHC